MQSQSMNAIEIQDEANDIPDMIDDSGKLDSIGIPDGIHMHNRTGTE